MMASWVGEEQQQQHNKVFDFLMPRKFRFLIFFSHANRILQNFPKFVIENSRKLNILPVGALRIVLRCCGVGSLYSPLTLLHHSLHVPAGTVSTVSFNLFSRQFFFTFELNLCCLDNLASLILSFLLYLPLSFSPSPSLYLYSRF